eukprot:TRINITY_DN283_c0_g1_i1.p1 TRINITY_DN283_c0_g1~~TRINITY_DN283_c0_g1_i1.p1  ORF type:complete len:135 (+),score=53.96 TRINITY_DN283_c0_g1_i1:135-539(+)
MSDWFFIVSEHNPNLVLDIEGGSNSASAKLIVWSYHGGDNQKFRFTPEGFLQNKKSNLVLDVCGGLNQGANIIQYGPHGGANQKWRASRDGTISLQSGQFVLDINGGSRDQGAHVIAWSRHGNSNQKWRICNHF